MSFELLLVFLPACFALNLAPGPNNLLSVANATRYGFLKACLAGCGRLIAFVGMIAIAASGVAVVLQASAWAFNLVKILGALYLFYLAFQLWSAPAFAAVSAKKNAVVSVSLWTLARQEFLVAAGNPKAILIFTAFLPQFVNPLEPAVHQFMMLGLAFLVLEWCAIAAYAFMGARLGRWFSVSVRQRMFNRSCGALLGMAGIGMLLSRRTAA